jgi:inner membrane protein
MFIGHLPAGYLAARYLWCRCEALRGVEWKYIVAAALLGSVFPDLDWFYFYFVDHRRHHHHTYWTHLPIFWVLAVPIALLSLRATRTPRAFALAAIFGGSAFVHLLLDSIVGQIWWLYPWVDQPFSLFVVDAIYRPWWLNFILHWSFLLEVALLGAATYVYVRGRNPTPWEG